MKSKFQFLVCAGILIFSAALAKDPPASAEQLRGQLEAAWKARDTNAVLALVNWKGVSDKMKSDTAAEMVDSVSEGAAGVKLLPLPPGFPLTNEMDGVRYFPNVRVQGLIEVDSFAEGNTNTTQLPYGESAGAFYIAGTAQETFDPSAKKSIPLAVMVMGLFPKETPGILSCSYVSVANGKEKTGSFQCTNNWSESFWGDCIKSCKVTKISGSGSFQLEINEGGKTVFDSGMVRTTNSIAYERKPQ